MTHDAETVERVAKAIFPAMIKAATTFATDCPHDWVAGGNSFVQDEARAAAFGALSAMSAQEVTVQDMPETDVGNFKHYYGGLLIRCVNGSAEWCIENYDGRHWKVCDPQVFAALRALSEKEQ